MKILIDVNHPAHVHYFRNFIKLMEAKGHEFCVINRDSKMINQLLDFYGIKHTIRNKRPKKKGTISSLMNLARMTLWCIRKSFSFRPDIYLGFASSACAITSWFFRKPSILLDDTEFNKMNHKIYMHFCSTVLTPFYFKKKLDDGKKQFFFNAFIEQLFLHSSYFKRCPDNLKGMGLTCREYVVVRYSAFDAHHDLMAHPLSEDFKKGLIEEIAKKYKVILSLERESEDPFYQPYLAKFSPEMMHEVEANAKFLVTEGITMASEAFIMGVPYLLINPLSCGYIDYQIKKYPNRSFYSIDKNMIIDYINRLTSITSEDNDLYRTIIEEETINPTAFLMWFVENYPESKRILKENPDYQYKFR